MSEFALFTVFSYSDSDSFMNVFILTTGRCGSTTFIKACRHIHNYTCAHESLTGALGEERFQYPDNHIEADNRLSWFLGRLEQTFGDEAFYVHLKRDKYQTALSFTRRQHKFGIIPAYSKGIVEGGISHHDLFDLCLDYCDTVNANIKAFLHDKSKKMSFSLENAKYDYAIFWKRIGAEGNLEAALAEWDIAYNQTTLKNKKRSWGLQKYGKFRRILRKFPTFIKEA